MESSKIESCKPLKAHSENAKHACLAINALPAIPAVFFYDPKAVYKYLHDTAAAITKMNFNCFNFLENKLEKKKLLTIIL